MKSLYVLMDLGLYRVCFSVLSCKCLWYRVRTLEPLVARAALQLWWEGIPGLEVNLVLSRNVPWKRSMLASSPTERSHGDNLLHSSKSGLRIMALEWPLLWLGSLWDDLCILRCSRFQCGITMWKLLLKERRLWRWDMEIWGWVSWDR